MISNTFRPGRLYTPRTEPNRTEPQIDHPTFITLVGKLHKLLQTASHGIGNIFYAFSQSTIQCSQYNIYVYIYIYTYHYISVSVSVSISISISISTYLSIHLSIHPSIYLCIYHIFIWEYSDP